METVPGAWYDESGAMPLVRGLLMQFRLSTLMLAFVVVAAWLGLFGGVGDSGRGGSPLDHSLRPPSGDAAASRAGCNTVPSGCCDGRISCYLVQRLVDVSHNVACRCHFLQVGLARGTYEKNNGCFPPAYQLDANSTPVHSWWALLMPYLDIAWNSHRPELRRSSASNNSKLIDLMDFRFACPEDSVWERPGMTSLVAVVGPITACPGATSRKWDASAGCMHLHAQVLLVEVADSGIKWAEPRDLSLEEALAGAWAGNRVSASPASTSSSAIHRGDRNGVFRLWLGFAEATTEPASRFPRSPAGRGRRRRPAGRRHSRNLTSASPLAASTGPQPHGPRGPRSVHRRAPESGPRFCRRAAWALFFHQDPLAMRQASDPHTVEPKGELRWDQYRSRSLSAANDSRLGVFAVSVPICWCSTHASLICAVCSGRLHHLAVPEPCLSRMSQDCGRQRAMHPRILVHGVAA